MTAKTPKFLRALYSLLDLESSDIIAWSPCGTYFQVKDVARLERDVLPRYFKHNKFASFQRQLNNFGFRKWTKTQASVCTFSHDVYHRCKLSELFELVQTAASLQNKSSISHRRPRSDSDADAPVHKKTKCEDARESSTDASDLLALDWSIWTGDNQVDELFLDDDCVGLPIELFFPDEKSCDLLDPLTLDESSSIDPGEWLLLADCLA